MIAYYESICMILLDYTYNWRQHEKLRNIYHYILVFFYLNARVGDAEVAVESQPRAARRRLPIPARGPWRRRSVYV